MLKGSMMQVLALPEKPDSTDENTLYADEYYGENGRWNFKRLLNRKYTIVCTNPPYLNRYNSDMKEFINQNYGDYASDLFSIFIYRNLLFCKDDGYCGYMTPNVWMFIKSYEKLREFIIENKDIVTLVQMAKGSFFKEATVDICAFVLSNQKWGRKGLYIRLENFKGNMEVQKQYTLEALQTPQCKYFYEQKVEEYRKIPLSPIAYWITEKQRESFESKLLGEYAYPKQGFATGANDVFLRLWHEVNCWKIGFSCNDREEAKESGKKWFPCNKGGAYRKWYGNNDYIANWENDGFAMKSFNKSVIRNPQFYFNEGITWSSLSSGNLSMRYSPKGFIFESKGSVCFLKDKGNLYYILGLVNSKVVDELLLVLSPTLDYHEGPISRIPVVYEQGRKEKIDTLVECCVKECENDWDAFETSWDFKRHPLV